MPANNPSPLIAFTTEVDARAYNSVPLFSMAPGGAVSGPGQDYFEGPLNFLNGRCSPTGLDLDAEVKAVKGGTWTIYLDIDDLVVIEDTAGAFTLEVGDGSRSAFGFAPTGIIASAVVGATNQVKATTNWVRGNVQNAHLLIDDGIAQNIPAEPYRAQDVITMLRATSLADADGGDASFNLQTQTVAAYGAGGYRWGINADGFVWLAVADTAATPPDGAGTWQLDDFQLWAGFKGDEVLQIVADVPTGTNLWYIEATYPCASSIMPTRPLRRPLVRRFTEVTNDSRLTSREIASNNVMDYEPVTVEWWLDGPADCRDLSTRWLQAVLARAPKGVRWTLYQNWGDPRRERFDVEVRTDTSGTTPAYDLLGTSELNGSRGRIRARRSIMDSAKQANLYPKSLLRRIPKTTILELAED